MDWRDKVITLYLEGNTNQSIADSVNVTVSDVIRVISAYAAIS